MKKIIALSLCCILLLQCADKPNEAAGENPEYPIKINTRYYISDIRSDSPNGAGLLVLLPIVTDAQNFSFELATPDSMYTYTAEEMLQGYTYKYSGDTLSLQGHRFLTQDAADGAILMIMGADTTVIRKK